MRLSSPSLSLSLSLDHLIFVLVPPAFLCVWCYPCQVGVLVHALNAALADAVETKWTEITAGTL